MKKNDRAPRKGPSLETVLLAGLFVKLILTAAFLLAYQAPGPLFSFKSEAWAEEAKDKKKAPAETKAPEAAKEQPAKDAKAPVEKDKKAPEAAPTAPPAPTVDETLTKQYQSMIEALKAREAELVRREQRLKERENALDILQKQVDERLTAIEATRKKLDDLVAKQEDLTQKQKVMKDQRIEHLVTAYKGMRPEKAGALVNNLEDEVAVQILSAMPGRNAGQILAFVNPEKAARLTKSISERKPVEKDGYAAEGGNLEAPTVPGAAPIPIDIPGADTGADAVEQPSAGLIPPPGKPSPAGPGASPKPGTPPPAGPSAAAKDPRAQPQ
jgi:flagellar motility protein MotE (MotC chaperone)